MRTVRPAMLTGVYANPGKELLRLRRQNLVYYLGCGAHIGIPDTQDNQIWHPRVIDAGMAYATSVFGEGMPILAGIAAARWWGLIPREISQCTVLVPRQHRNVVLSGGMRVYFSIKGYAAQDCEIVTSQLGRFKIQSREQVLLDLVSRPDWGGMRPEALVAARDLVNRVNLDKVARLAAAQKLKSCWAKFNPAAQ